MSKSGEWYLQKEEEHIRFFERGLEEREEAIAHVKKAWELACEAQFKSHGLGPVPYDSPTFHAAIWEASVMILPGLEVQVVIDDNNVAHVSTGSPGYVDFQINPVGMKLPIKCWIHTHPFGAAYFSGTDIHTVSIWEPRMKEAYVLGGLEHFGHWTQDAPKQLMIYNDGKLIETQTWHKRNGEQE